MSYQFHHLHLICSNLEETISFFCDILGSELVERRKFGISDGATLNHGGTRINLRVGRETNGIEGDASRVQYGYDHIGFEVEDLDAVYNKLKDKGYIFTVLPEQRENLKFAFFKGPDNITIEIMQPVN